jgi:hypothetical protein
MSMSMVVSAEVDSRKTTRISLARAPAGALNDLSVGTNSQEADAPQKEEPSPVAFMTCDGTTKYQFKDAGQHEDGGNNGHVLAQCLAWNELRVDHHDH